MNNKSLIVESSFKGLDGKQREFTEAIDLSTGNVVEIRYKGIARDFQKSGSEALESSVEAQDLVDQC